MVTASTLFPAAWIRHKDPAVAQPLNFKGSGTTGWSSTLSSNVNLPHAINFRALYGANLVT